MPSSDPFLAEVGTLVAADQAWIELDKLIKYSLNPGHASGGNKAKVFAQVLGSDRTNADQLLNVIAAGVRATPARRHSQDEHGTRFEVDLQVQGPSGRQATVRTGWIYRDGKLFPR